MLIYEALKKDHDALKPLLERLVQMSQADIDGREELIEQIRDELVPHSRAEEAIFYNSLRSIEPTKDLVMHAYGEHAGAEVMLRTLQAAEKIDANFKKVAKELRDSLLHHIEEEEGRIFESARQVLIDEEARQMAVAFERLKPEVREQSFMQNTLDMIANMMPQRFMAPLRSFNHKA